MTNIANCNIWGQPFVHINIEKQKHLSWNKHISVKYKTKNLIESRTVTLHYCPSKQINDCWYFDKAPCKTSVWIIENAATTETTTLKSKVGVLEDQCYSA